MYYMYVISLTPILYIKAMVYMFHIKTVCITFKYIYIYIHVYINHIHIEPCLNTGNPVNSMKVKKKCSLHKSD